ncbi:MAG: glycosyltransferase family 2 protein [Gaiellaceae bacterium]
MIAPPRVSVIIPTRNRSALVVEAVESVLRQSFGDLEVIVADDGSTDDTAARLGALAGPVRYLRLPETGGPARARNAALDLARGALVAFLDDDDAWEPEKLARQVALLDADASVDLVHTGFSILDDDGAVTAPQLAPWQTARGPLFDRLFRGCFVSLSSVVIRRASLERAAGFDERRPVAEDYALWLRLGPDTTAACIPEPLVRLRRGGPTLSTREPLLVYDVSVSILADLLERGGLDLPQRLRCRTAISDLHARASVIAVAAGRRSSARRHAMSGLRRQPLNRRAWKALRRTLSPGSG